MVVNLVLARSLQANRHSSLLNDVNFAATGSGDQSGSGHYSGSGDDHHGSNDNSTTCHCNGTNLIVSSCLLTKWLSPSKQSSGLHKLASEADTLKSLTDNKEVSI